MNRMMKSDKTSPADIFIVINLAMIIWFFAHSMITGGVSLDWLEMENKDLNFCDLSMHLAAVADRRNVYFRYDWAGAGCFPAFSYLIYFFLYKLIFRDGPYPIDRYDIEKLPYYDLLIVFYTVFVCLLLYIAVSLWIGNNARAVILFICLITSVPLMGGGISVGNSTVLVMSLILIALKLRVSDSPVLRETALILLAICAALKIYPAVLGLLYLREKRYREAGRLTLYGILLFTLPYAAFGGIRGFCQWFDNIKVTSGYLFYGRIQCIKGLLYTLNTLTGFNPPLIIYSLIPLLFALVMIALAYFSADTPGCLFYLSAVMIFFPNNCYRYTLCYMIIPMIAWYADNRDRLPLRDDYIRALIFTLIFAVPMPFGCISHFGLGLNAYTLTYVEVWIYAVSYLALIIIGIREALRIPAAVRTA